MTQNSLFIVTTVTFYEQLIDTQSQKLYCPFLFAYLIGLFSLALFLDRPLLFF